MFLKDKLRITRMNKGECVTPYLTMIQDVWDKLSIVGEAPQESEMVCIGLNGFTPEWDTFVQGITRLGTLPDWNRLWEYFT